MLQISFFAKVLITWYFSFTADFLLFWQFQATYGKPLVAARDSKCSAKDAEAGILAMEALHKQVNVIFYSFNLLFNFIILFSPAGSNLSTLLSETLSFIGHAFPTASNKR